MKKSYDYFKTLKLLSESVSVIYKKTLLKQDYSSEKIIFSAEKSELINNLKNEFITPFERGDIFLLEENITEELDSVLSFQDYYNLSVKIDSGIFLKAEKHLITQTDIFSDLKNFKSNLKLFEQCSDEIKNLNSFKRKVEGLVIEELKCKNEQSFVKYAMYSALLDLNKKAYKTILQIERILLENS